MGRAILFARQFNLAESFIGATAIAIGTSLPELSIGLQALKKKQYGLALGDSVGSNMMNLTLVLGSAAILSPIAVSLPVFIAALIFAIIASVLLLYVAAVDKKMGRRGGLIFIGLYILYLLFIFYLQLENPV